MKKAYLGIDIGSISTKGVVIDEDNNIIASSYLYTEGNPIVTSKKVVKELKNKTEKMTSLLLEDKEKTLLFEQKKNQEEELERLKKELEAERNKGFFSRLFKK